MKATDCRIQGREIPKLLLGELRETEFHSDNGLMLQEQLATDGYLFLRDALNIRDVLAARAEVFERLAEVGEIKPPAHEGIATGSSQRRERVEDLGQFWQSVSEGPALRRASHGTQAKTIMTALVGQEARPHDYIFLRPGVVGRATLLHYDYPFFARGSQRVYTMWSALGDIPVDEGPLVVVENSHHFDDLIEPIRLIDYDSANSPRVQLTGDAIEFARARKTRLLTAIFRVGDVIIFTMTTLHGTLDNHLPFGRTRLSCDVRWQPATDPVDSRYVGPNPPGTTGAGYGELNGAKPLTEEWHER